MLLEGAWVFLVVVDDCDGRGLVVVSFVEGDSEHDRSLVSGLLVG